MPIEFRNNPRTKITEVCTREKREVSGHRHETYDLVCTDQEIPIREWNFSPEVLNIRWVEGSPMPSSELITIVFPELENLIEYKQKQVREVFYKIENTTASDFIEFHSQEDWNRIPAKKNGKVQLRASFKNFHRLSQNKNRIELNCQVFGTLTEGAISYQKLLEQRKYIIQIQKITHSSAPYITTDKNEYFITYIQSSKKLLGDTNIGVHIHNMPVYKGIIQMTTFINEYSSQVENQSFKEIPITIKPSARLLQDRSFNARIHLGSNQTTTLSTLVTIHLSVKEHQEGFDIDQNQFDFELFYHQNQRVTGTLHITNYSNLSFTFEKSDWITLSNDAGQVTFSTPTAQELGVGTHRGFVKIMGGSFVKIVQIQVIVRKNITFNLQNINFCLDAPHIIVQKTKPQATFLKMQLQMQMTDYDQKEQTIEQTYQYVFFEDQVTLYPGEEIQDFFSQIHSVEQLRIYEQETVTTQNLFKACQVRITLIQYNEQASILAQDSIGSFYFLPGKKPKAYPYLTNAPKRRTYSHSLICISAIQEDFLHYQLSKIAGVFVDNTLIQSPKYVVSLCFRRSIADSLYTNEHIIKKEGLELHPFPNPEQTIDVIFQNQNLCPDWFTFSGEWEEHTEISHSIAENIQNGHLFKAHSQSKKTIHLNTGWILEQEIELLTELIVSPLCFAHIQGQWRKLIPINKKIISYHSLDNVRSFIVEFQDITN